jgi:hypothetical protein
MGRISRGPLSHRRRHAIVRLRLFRLTGQSVSREIFWGGNRAADAVAELGGNQVGVVDVIQMWYLVSLPSRRLPVRLPASMMFSLPAAITLFGR